MKCLVCALETPGHLYPMVGIARALVARGHEVAFVADVGCEPLLSAQGLTRIPRGPSDGRSFLVSKWFVPISVAIQVKHIEFALKRFSADVIVSQALALGPLLVRERRRLPAALLGFISYLWPTGTESGSVSIDASVTARLAWRYREMMASFNDARKLFRMPPSATSYEESPLMGDLFMLRSIPQIENRIEALPERVRLIGSCLWESGGYDSELEEWLINAKASRLPIIYVQHGRFFHIPNFWAQLKEALGGLDCWVVASTDRMDQEVGTLPANFFVRPYVPQGRVLKDCKAVVASANTTVVLGSLAQGVPSLLIPGGGEQIDVAALGERIGVSIVILPQEATAQALRHAIGRLLKDKRYEEQAKHFRRLFSEVDSFGLAVDLIEEVVSKGRSVRSSESFNWRGPARLLGEFSVGAKVGGCTD